MRKILTSTTVLLLTSCGFFEPTIKFGAKFVDDDYVIDEYLVLYQLAQHPSLEGDYYLVRDKCELALFRNRTKEKLLVTNHWVADDGDHFALIYSDDSVEEYVVLFDRAQAMHYYALEEEQYTREVFKNTNESLIKIAKISPLPPPDENLVPAEIYGL